MSKQINSLTITLFICIGVLLFLFLQTCSKVKQAEQSKVDLIAALNDSLTTYRKKDSSQVATISTIQMQSANDFLKLHVKDREIQDLQKVVKENKSKLTKAGSSVTNITSETVIKGTGKPKVEFDTTYKDTGSVKYVKVYPTYTDSLYNEWVRYKTVINKDSATREIRIINKYTTVVGYDKGKPYTDVTSYNPYSNTKTVRTFQTTVPKPKKFGLGFSGGATYYNQQIQPYIGAGINYNIIRF